MFALNMKNKYLSPSHAHSHYPFAAIKLPIFLLVGKFLWHRMKREDSQVCVVEHFTVDRTE